MPPDNNPEPTVFSAVLRPHRSLRSTGFVALMLVYGIVSFVGGIVFSMMGAWPIVVFFALDGLLLYWAMRVNYGRAAAYEEVTITPSTLTVRKVSHRGRPRKFVFNPLWVQLDKIEHEEYGMSACRSSHAGGTWFSRAFSDRTRRRPSPPPSPGIDPGETGRHPHGAP